MWMVKQKIENKRNIFFKMYLPKKLGDELTQWADVISRYWVHYAEIKHTLIRRSKSQVDGWTKISRNNAFNEMSMVCCTESTFQMQINRFSEMHFTSSHWNFAKIIYIK